MFEWWKDVVWLPTDWMTVRVLSFVPGGNEGSWQHWEKFGGSGNGCNRVTECNRWSGKWERVVEMRVAGEVERRVGEMECSEWSRNVITAYNMGREFTDTNKHTFCRSYIAAKFRIMNEYSGGRWDLEQGQEVWLARSPVLLSEGWKDTYSTTLCLETQSLTEYEVVVCFLGWCEGINSPEDDKRQIVPYFCPACFIFLRLPFLPYIPLNSISLSHLPS